jgi:SAM-dependent methyltransferase
MGEKTSNGRGTVDPRVEGFISRWQGREGGQERANYALFMTELCDLLGLPHPDPASAAHTSNDYVFERVVREPGREGTVSSRRIDLYKKDCFVLEAKQSRQKGGIKEVQGQSDLFVTEAAPRGRRGAERAWDVLMLNARRQAEDYVRLLPSGHEPPPFVLVCDVGHCFEVYANFRRDGKAYDQFPDRQSFRIYLEDLRRSEVRDHLIAIWTEPQSLDPAKTSARVTRAIAQRLAAVSKALEEQHHSAEEVAMFIMRCLFTMFAEDVGLLPEKSFKEVLERCEQDPDTFENDVGQLWEAMDEGGYAHAIRKNVPRFNGEFFKQRTVLPLRKEEIGELRQAAFHNWREVDPSIFGTLLEQALDPIERRRLGAHYTPRPYVERLVIATVMEPLREDWGHVLSTAERQKSEGRGRDALRTISAFHEKLCATRVLDPACGTGNFLYVSLELVKRLEGEVLEAASDLGGQEALGGLEGHTVDPHQFMGMELNPRAVAIAELVLWIGHLQWHVRTKGGMPGEPILRAFKNIVAKDAVLAPDLSRPQRPEWAEAEFIVGNPPFIGGKDIRARLTDDYVQALWAAHPHMNESADFVMYWWDRAAEFLTRKGTVLRRFGLVTTNSISQVFQRRVMERHLTSKKPMSLVMAIPDHPWTKSSQDAAAVRIAMTVGEAGSHEGVLREVVRETGLETDEPLIEMTELLGVMS